MRQPACLVSVQAATCCASPRKGQRACKAETWGYTQNPNNVAVPLALEHPQIIAANLDSSHAKALQAEDSVIAAQLVASQQPACLVCASGNLLRTNHASAAHLPGRDV
jgi:hypothetical protein